MTTVSPSNVTKPRLTARTLAAKARATQRAKSLGPQTFKKTRGEIKGVGTPSSYATMFRATPLERIHLIRRGIPAVSVIETSEAMGLSKEQFLATLQLTRATVNRRLKAKEALPTDYSERIIGLQKLIGQVEIMVAESGDPSGFNAALWVANWLEQPIPALNNARPADFMDTIEGQELVSTLLAKMQSGAYA